LVSESGAASLVEISSETGIIAFSSLVLYSLLFFLDFLGRNKEFQSFAATVASTFHSIGSNSISIGELLLQQPTNILPESIYDTAGAKTVQDLLGLAVTSLR